MCNLMEFNNILEKIMGHLPKRKDFDFYKFLSSILLDEFNKIDILEFRETILNKILEKNDLIKYSSQIIKTIIEYSCVDSEPDSMVENLDVIKEEDSPMFWKLNKTKNAFLEEVIMNIFERKIIKYYELIPALDKKKLKENYITYFEQNKTEKNKTGIIFDKSLDMFKEAIELLEQISISNKDKDNEIENMNLLKLYSIVYVKIYLYHFVYFLINNFHQMKDIREIVDYINNIRDREFSKVIKIYILKLIFNIKNRNFEEFKKFEFSKYEINFYEKFHDCRKKENILLTYLFLPSEPTEYVNYNQILSVYMKDIYFNYNCEELINILY